jgi:hypothetical protein
MKVAGNHLKNLDHWHIVQRNLFWFVQLDTFGEDKKTTYLGCLNLEKKYFIKNKNANFILRKNDVTAS